MSGGEEPRREGSSCDEESMRKQLKDTHGFGQFLEKQEFRRYGNIPYSAYGLITKSQAAGRPPVGPSSAGEFDDRRPLERLERRNDPLEVF